MPYSIIETMSIKFYAIALYTQSETCVLVCAYNSMNGKTKRNMYISSNG